MDTKLDDTVKSEKRKLRTKKTGRSRSASGSSMLYATMCLCVGVRVRHT